MADKKEAKPQSVTLDVTLLTNKVEAITALDAQLNKAKGTMAEVLKRGADEAGSFSFNAAFLMSGGETIADTMLALELQLSNLKQVRDEFTKAWITANVSTAEVDALKSQRDTLVNEAEAVRSVLVQMGVAEAATVELPSAPKVNNSSNSVPATSGIKFYYLEGAKKVYKAPSQNTLSSMAFYAPIKVPTADLKAALKAAGWDGTMTTSQQFEIVLPSLTEGGENRKVTMGWDVTPNATAKADA